MLRRIKSDWRTATIPVVVLTSSDDAGLLEALGLGAAGSLAKPVDFEEFLEAASRFRLYWRTRSSRRVSA